MYKKIARIAKIAIFFKKRLRLQAFQNAIFFPQPNRNTLTKLMNVFRDMRFHGELYFEHHGNTVIRSWTMGQLSSSLIGEVSKSNVVAKSMTILLSLCLQFFFVWGSVLFFVSSIFTGVTFSPLCCFFILHVKIVVFVFRQDHTFTLSKRHRGFVVRQSIGFQTKYLSWCTIFIMPFFS